MIRLFHIFSVALVLCVSVGKTFAEDYPKLKPKEFQPDINSVNLTNGKYYPSYPILSVPAAPRLTFDTVQKLVSELRGEHWYTFDFENGVSNNPRLFTVSYGGVTSESFSCATEGCISQGLYGSILVGSGTTWFSDADDLVVYRNPRTGFSIRFEDKAQYTRIQNGSNVQTRARWYATTIGFADGESLSFEYDTFYDSAVADFTYHRPLTVTSNVGYQLKLSYHHDNVIGVAPAWGAVKTAEIVSLDNPSVPLVKYTYTYVDGGVEVTDLANRTWLVSGFESAVGATDYVGSFGMVLPSDNDERVSVDFSDQNAAPGLVGTVVNNGAEFSYTYTNPRMHPIDGRRIFDTVDITSGAYQRTVELDHSLSGNRPRISSSTDAFNNVTHYEYKGASTVLEQITFPEGNKERYTYDSFGNVTAVHQIPKPGTGLTNIVATAVYDTDPVCDIGFACYRPTSITDPNGKKTDYSFDSQHGGLLTKTEPEDLNGKRRITTNTYTDVNPLARIETTSICSASSCSDSDKQVLEYTYWGNTKLPLTVTKTNGVGQVKQITTYGYDEAGRTLSIDGPLVGSDDATYMRYDIVGRKTWEIGPKNSAGYRVAQRFTYRDQDDQIEAVETGTVTSATSSNLTVYSVIENYYDNNGNVIEVVELAADQTQSVTQYSYDANNNLRCRATRMNPGVFNALPSDACSLSNEGSYGKDRIERHYHDALFRVSKIVEGYGTPDNGTEVEYTYTDNGQIETRKDGNGNTTTYTYDGFDRLYRTTYPDATFEELSYDNNNNVKTERRRDGLTLTNYYDNINSLKKVVIPGETDLSYDYDVIGRKVSAKRGNAETTYEYDELSRANKVTTNGRVISYQYNIADQLEKLTYPDGSFVSYDISYGGNLEGIYQGSTTLINEYGYTPLGELETITFGNGRITNIAYNDRRLIGSFEHKGLNKSDFSYNPASQITSRTASNADFQVSIPSTGTKTYVPNALNQYTSVGSNDLDYDLKGNLTDYNGWDYEYSAHNRLTSAVKSGTTISLAYDAEGMLWSTTVNGTQTFYVYSGDKLIAEYSSSGNLLRKYVHGLEVDNPVIWYEGAGTSDKRYLHADERGSVISETDAQGILVASHRYGPYGELESSSNSRFRYTGQILIPGTELYYYKARVYLPELGRFLQTDPIGYEDQMNLYAYVHNDPLTYTDPTGKFSAQMYQATPPEFHDEIGAVTGQGLSALDTASDIAMPVKGLVKTGIKTAIKKAFSKVFGKKSGSCCFVAGTQVLTEDGYKNIEDVELGEKLWAKNTDTGEQDWKPVTKIFVEPDRGIYEIKLIGSDGFEQKIETTDDHPFYVVGEGWKTTIELVIGDYIETDGDGAMMVTSVIDEKRQDLTYNFTVADFHTYYVTERKVLVHNCNIRMKGSGNSERTTGSVGELKDAVNEAGYDANKLACAKCKLETSIKNRTAEQKRKGQTAGTKKHADRIKQEKAQLEKVNNRLKDAQ